MRVIEALRALLGKHAEHVFWRLSTAPGAQPIAWLGEDLLQALEDETNAVLHDMVMRYRNVHANQEPIDLFVLRSNGKDIYARLGQGRPLVYTGLSFDVAVPDV